MEWEVVIGLETHTQLKTNTKIFSGASIKYGAEPNTQADEVSIALPGVLPVLNKQAVECAIKFGLAIYPKATKLASLSYLLSAKAQSQFKYQLAVKIQLTKKSSISPVRIWKKMLASLCTVQ
jgi:hypothetical protein